MRKITTLFFSGLAFLGIAAIGCNGYDQETFTATLSGANEVPATAATATGTFSITFDGPAAKYTLNIAGGGLAQITGAHIHTGAPGANGSIMVFLFDNWLTATQTDFTSITTTANTIVGATGSFIVKGFKVGDVVRLTNHSTAANNNVNLTITALTATVMTVAQTLTVDAVADATFELNFVNATAFSGNLGVGSFTTDMVAACTPGCQATTGVTPTRTFDNILAGAQGSAVYVNVHTLTLGGGAIRGNIHP